jgi:predicted enzyme related to lactoylglutathione lyase
MPGSIVHFEPPAGDADRTRAFRNRVFDWS